MDPTANAIPGLEDGDAEASGCEYLGGPESADTCPHDTDSLGVFWGSAGCKLGSEVSHTAGVFSWGCACPSFAGSRHLDQRRGRY